MPPIEVQSNKTFTDLYGEHKNNVVVFGNPDAPEEFQAHAKLEFWGENHITFCDKGVKGTPSLAAEKLSLDCGPEKSIDWWQYNNTGLKWVITLKKKPVSNKYQFELGGDWHEFYWRYNPPLAEEFGEMEEFEGHDGDIWIRPKNYESLDTYSQRPVRVDGSISVKHKTKRDHVIGGKNYKAGKVLHIFRPRPVDDKGESTWADLEVKDGVMTVTIPQDFLDSAVYPVIINDEWGYHSAGGTEHVNSTGTKDQVAWGLQSPPADGTATAIYAYCRAGSNHTLGIWDDSAGNPNNAVADGANLTSGATDEWVGGALDSGYGVFAASSYHLGGKAGDSIAYHYDAGSITMRLDAGSGAYTPGQIDNWSGTGSSWASRDLSLYVVYTPSGGAAGQPAMRRGGGVPGMQLTGRRSW